MIDLPAQSPLAMTFAKKAIELGQWSGHYADAASFASNRLHDILRDAKRNEGVTTPMDRAADVLLEAAAWSEDNDNDWALTLRQMASLIRTERW